MQPETAIRLRCALFIGVIALAARLTYCFAISPSADLKAESRDVDFFQLTDGYIDLAVNLVEHHRFSFLPDARPTTHRAPLYPAVVAAGYWLHREIISTTLWVNCLASALTCVILYAAMAPLLNDEFRCGFMLPVVFFPMSIYYCASSYSDTFITLTVVLYVWTLLRLFAQRTSLNAVWNGLAFAAMCLAKPVTLLFPIVLIPFVAWRARKWLPPILLSTGIACIPIAAWSVRNMSVSGEFIPVCGGGGFNLLIGNFMIDRGDDPGKSYLHAESQALKRVNDRFGLHLTRDSIRTGDHLDLTPGLESKFGAIAKDMFVQNPLLLARKCAINLWRIWTFSTSRSRFVFNTAVNLSVLVLSSVTVVRLIRAGRIDVATVMLFLAYLVATYTVVVVSLRYCLPIVLILTPFATATVMDWFRARQGGGAAPV